MINGFNQLLNAAVSGATGAVVSKVFTGLGVDIEKIANQSTGSSSDSTNALINALLASGAGSTGIGAALRMIQNLQQGLGYGAAPEETTFTKAIVKDDYTTSDTKDWRIKITGPPELMTGQILQPIVNTQNSMLFPFTPTVILGSTANYSNISPVHTNHPFYAYENSQVQDITITGEFFSENETDAKYWVACLHFLRTMTKMYYGKSDNLGSPPPVCRLNGYGKHVFNDIPVLISNFTTDMPADVDYIQCDIDNETTFVPTQSIITVTLIPNYARSTQSQFSLEKFAKGDFINTGEGFV